MSILHERYLRLVAYVATLTTLSYSSLLVGCSSSDERGRDSACDNCIAFEPIAVLGDSAGDGYIEETEYMTRDRLGNHWVGQRGTVKIFDSTGRFVRNVGRPGQGPMEFSGFIAPRYTDERGRVHIFDTGNLRETVVGPDFKLVAEATLPGSIGSVAPLPDGRRRVVNMVLETADGIGLPLHIIEGSQVLRSFGATESTESSGIVTPFALQRVLATDAHGRIYSTPPYEYVVDVWSDEGEKIRTFTGPILNETKPLPGSWSPDNPPPNRIFSLRVDDAQRLWVVSWIRRPDWQKNMIEAPLPNGTIQFKPKDESLQSIFRSRIDVIDLDRAAVIASTERDELMAIFIDDAFLVEYRLSENWTPQLVVWRATFVNPSVR